MTVQSGSMFESMPNVECAPCHAIVEKWINYTQTGNLCINCAHAIMRILLQDIIEYHNGKSISLLEIMHHGNKDENGKRLPHGIKPSGKLDFESGFYE